MFYISLYYSEVEFLLVIPSFSRTHYCSEFLPWVMTPVNSTSRRASTSNQWLVSSGSAHHAPPYRSSSLSEPCGRHSWSQTDFFHPNLQTDKRDAHSWRRRKSTCMLSRPLWAVKPWWDWDEDSSWSSSTRWDSKPRGGQTERERQTNRIWLTNVPWKTLIENIHWLHSLERTRRPITSLSKVFFLF